MTFLLPLNGAELNIIIDALNRMDYHYDEALRTGLLDRLKAGYALHCVVPNEVLRNMGIGRSQGRPQG